MGKYTNIEICMNMKLVCWFIKSNQS